jgi:hypothetical protein
MVDRLEDILTMTDRAEAYYRLIDYFVKSSDTERNRIRNSWSFGKEWTYPCRKTLVGVDPNQRSCYERIRALLTYYAFGDSEIDKEDFRQGFVALALYYHALREIGQDPAILFEETAKISSPDMAIPLRRFITEKEENKSLEFFGIKKIVDKDGQVEFQHDYFDDTIDVEAFLRRVTKDETINLEELLRRGTKEKGRGS